MTPDDPYPTPTPGRHPGSQGVIMTVSLYSLLWQGHMNYLFETVCDSLRLDI